MSISFKKLSPLLNRVLVKRAAASTTSAGGIILTEEKEMAYGEVVAHGPGVSEEGGFRDTCVKKGDTVLLPSWEGQKIELNGEELSIYRDTDILGILSEKVQ
ncbi:unnamed protein product [Moneuplotes crassus]|uniref:20 kDa chaperonin, chloroplastic n=1 Tax=Euplotes crassus TaxID=5936 RepID=A0AAD1Y9B5_EUPCR|nr:unnamed protein product [Moneuplotes crassus]